ncbi:MAG TPA: hypothetical protein VIG52_07385 [Methyloceanibacter sp.]|jgi:hypothetical protein
MLVLSSKPIHAPRRPLRNGWKTGVPIDLKSEVVMPSKSAKQHRFMEAAAHNPAFAKKAGISQKVAKEFVSADQAKAKAKRKKMGATP